MVLKRVDTGTVVLTAASETVTIGRIAGKIKKIEITCSASTDFWIYADASVNDNTVVDENILGVTGTKITVNTTLIAYPVVAQVVGSTNATTDPDQFSLIMVDGTLKFVTANAAAADTCRIIIFYEPVSD